MRVLVLVHEYPPIGGGGGKVAEDICEGLVSRGHAVKVITSHLKGLTSVETRSGVEIIRLRCGRRYAYKASFSSMFWFIITGFLRGLKEIRSWKPDIVHVHFAVPAGAIGYALYKMTRIGYVLTAHLGDVPGGVPEKTDRWFKLVKPLTPPIWKNARQIIAVSEFTRSLAQKIYPIPMQVIPNGITLNDDIVPEISTHHPPRIVFAGRFVPQKNPLQVIRSLNELKDINWHCTMMGDGPLRADMEKEIWNSGLSDRIDLPGWLTPEVVVEEFGKSDVLFMPSLSEGLPVVGIQAMSRGLALVTSTAGGWADLVKPGQNGYQFAPDDSAGFSKGLRDLLTDETKLADARRESLKLVNDFDLKSIVVRYEQALSSALITNKPV